MSRMVVLLFGTLVLLTGIRPDQHGAAPRPVQEEDFWDSYQWRVAYEDWRREHPGAARMLDQFEREINAQRGRALPEDCSVDCQ